MLRAPYETERMDCDAGYVSHAAGCLLAPTHVACLAQRQECHFAGQPKAAQGHVTQGHMTHATHATSASDAGCAEFTISSDAEQMESTDEWQFDGHPWVGRRAT